ncbi:MAG TPA: hypothetical protein P5234_10455 [Thermoanaerobaculaceae bacterium]|nr:hypothetical protein [Thermoanaerobaculaceae bacterium]HRS16649.1 hypothetical protein [Thermoanaerobaculaceae bacterium]
MIKNVARRCSPLVVLAALVAVASACTTPISDLKADPRKYEGKTVTIKGTVTASASILFVKGFWLEDGTGKILVSPKGAVPREGEVVTVRGRVEQVVAVGPASAVIFKEE